MVVSKFHIKELKLLRVCTLIETNLWIFFICRTWIYEPNFGCCDGKLCIQIGKVILDFLLQHIALLIIWPSWTYFELHFGVLRDSLANSRLRLHSLCLTVGLFWGSFLTRMLAVSSPMSRTGFLFSPAFAVVFALWSWIRIWELHGYSSSQNGSDVVESVHSFNFLLFYFFNFPQLDAFGKKK